MLPNIIYGSLRPRLFFFITRSKQRRQCSAEPHFIDKRQQHDCLPRVLLAAEVEIDLLGIEVLDWDARLFQVPHFLSDAEADEMLDLGHGALTEKFGDEWFDDLFEITPARQPTSGGR